jgi:hypothetical protein
MSYFKAFLAIILLSSCSAQYHMRTALRKDPSILVADTVVRYDTIIVQVDKVDTVFKYNFDTVEYWQDKVHIKYHYSHEDSIVYIEADCPDNEIIVEEKTITETITIKPTVWQRVETYLFIVAALVVLWWIKKR